MAISVAWWTTNIDHAAGCRNTLKNLIVPPARRHSIQIIMVKSLLYSTNTFDELLALAETALFRKEFNNAAALVQAAARSAWSNHAGLFHSPKAEQILRELSDKYIGNPPQRLDYQPQSGERKSVLHVLTQAYKTGGHTRLVWRWIAADPGSQHHVVLTRQGREPIPPLLDATTRHQNGEVHVLDRYQEGLLEIATMLRQISAGFDFIVLHTHPDDVVPTLAWAVACSRAPIILLNHADHVFWLGGTICDLIVNIRRSGCKLSSSRRGIPESRNTMLSIPLSDRTERPTRDDARRSLRMSESAQLAVTIASSYKFSIANDVDFMRIHYPIFQKINNFQLIVVGPTETEPYWHHWSERTNHRVQAVGTQLNTDIFLAAADIYLDSSPFGSLTSLLEAGLAGLPCVSWRPYAFDSPAAVLSSDDITLDKYPIAFTDETEYRLHIQELLCDAKKSRRCGTMLREMLLKDHIDDWRNNLASVYNLASSIVDSRPHVIDKNFLGEPGYYDEQLWNFQRAAGKQLVKLPRSFSLMERILNLRRQKAGLVDVIKEFVPGWAYPYLGVFRRVLTKN